MECWYCLVMNGVLVLSSVEWSVGLVMNGVLVLSSDEWNVDYEVFV